MKVLFDKLEYTGYIDSIQADLEIRVESYENDVQLKETIEERIKTIKNHVALLAKTRNYIETIFGEHMKLLKKEQDRLKI